MLDDKVFEPYASEMFSLTGKSGDAFATDTSRCFHMGSRTRHDSGRLVLMFHYVTPVCYLFLVGIQFVDEAKASSDDGPNPDAEGFAISVLI